MKKNRVLIPILIAICLCIIVGFTTIPVVRNFVADDNKTAEQSKENEQTDNTKNDSENSKIVGSEEVILSAEDKAVKAEIAKYSNTNFDFRYARQENIKDKTFDLTFSEVEQVAGYKRILYKNDFGDEFVYNIDNGRLRYATIKSEVVEKTDGSINQAMALKIAEEYVGTQCDKEKYMLDQQKEIESGYYFCFTRYIGGYPSSDRYSIQVGYDKAIVYFSDFTDTFVGKDLNYTKEFIDSKIKENSDATKVDWDSVSICLNEGKVSVSYAIPEQAAIAILHLE